MTQFTDSDKFKCLQNFFTNLQNRLYKENQLSDITCAMCQSSVNFKVVFLKFLFDDINVDHDTSIVREVTSQNGSRTRVDLLIKTRKQQVEDNYLVECKINDKTPHPTYPKDFNVPSNNFCYITNDTNFENDDTKCYHWKDIKEHLKNTLNMYYLRLEEDERLLWLGYIYFLEATVNEIPLPAYPFTFDGLRHFAVFKTLVKKLFLEQLLDTENYIAELYSATRTGEGHVWEDKYGSFGRPLKLTYINPYREIGEFPILVLRHQEQSIKIGVLFTEEENWCSNDMINVISSNTNCSQNMKYCIYSSEQVNRCENHWLTLNSYGEDELKRSCNSQRQLEILKFFLQEVFDLGIKKQ